MKKLVFLFIGIIVGCILHSQCSRADHTPADTDTVSRRVTVDTITIYKPVPRDSVVIRYEVATLPRKQETEPTHEEPTDSAAVIIPITQAVYRDTLFTAYVSGYRPRLDSITVYPPREILTIRKPPRRWSIGLQAGYGYTPRGLRPYIGIGIAFKIAEF